MSQNGYISDNNFREYQITAYLDDDFSTVFTGTWGMGPMLVDNDDFSAHLMPYGLLQKRTDVIYIEGDSIWLAGNGGKQYSDEFQTRLGVTLYEKSKEEFTWLEPRYIYGFDSEIIFDIAGDKKNLYFAGLNGLTINKRNTNEYITLTRQNGLPQTEVTALAVAPDSVWIGTYQGLALYTPSVDTMVIVSKSVLGKLFITDLELADSKLFIGSTDGAFYIDFRTLDVGRLQDPEGNLGGEIRHISTHKNEVIISSNSGVTMINLLTNKSEEIPFIDFALGAYAAVANDKYFAIAVQDGLLLLTRDKAPKHNHFDIDDGLLSNNISTIVPDVDYIWLGSEEGLTRFKWINPDRVD
jgi:ligand-binding sensor domain-containing protein